jgi:hypothetical protein
LPPNDKPVAPVTSLIGSLRGLSVRYRSGASLATLRQLLGGLPSSKRCAGGLPLGIWRGPGEILVLVGKGHASACETELARLAPGVLPGIAAFEITDGVDILELASARLDDWLCGVADAAALPRHASESAICRAGDVSVTIIRRGPATSWIVVERPSSAYLCRLLLESHSSMAAGVSRKAGAAEGRPASGAARLAEGSDMDATLRGWTRRTWDGAG